MYIRWDVREALVKCHDFACPALSKVGSISNCRNFVMILQISPSSCLLLALLLIYMFSMYMTLGSLLDRHAPLICDKIKKEPARWLSDTYRRAKSIRCQFEHMWRKNRSRLHKQIARATQLSTVTRLNTTAMSSMTTALTQRSYGRRYAMSLIGAAR